MGNWYLEKKTEGKSLEDSEEDLKADMDWQNILRYEG